MTLEQLDVCVHSKTRYAQAHFTFYIKKMSFRPRVKPELGKNNKESNSIFGLGKISEI